MSIKIEQQNLVVINGELKKLVRGNIEEALNELLQPKDEKVTHAA